MGTLVPHEHRIRFASVDSVPSLSYRQGGLSRLASLELPVYLCRGWAMLPLEIIT